MKKRPPAVRRTADVAGFVSDHGSAKFEQDSKPIDTSAGSVDDTRNNCLIDSSENIQLLHRSILKSVMLCRGPLVGHCRGPLATQVTLSCYPISDSHSDTRNSTIIYSMYCRVSARLRRLRVLLLVEFTLIMSKMVCNPRLIRGFANWKRQVWPSLRVHYR